MDITNYCLGFGVLMLAYLCFKFVFDLKNDLKKFGE